MLYVFHPDRKPEVEMAQPGMVQARVLQGCGVFACCCFVYLHPSEKCLDNGGGEQTNMRACRAVVAGETKPVASGRCTSVYERHVPVSLTVEVGVSAAGRETLSYHHPALRARPITRLLTHTWM